MRPRVWDAATDSVGGRLGVNGSDGDSDVDGVSGEIDPETDRDDFVAVGVGSGATTAVAVDVPVGGSRTVGDSDEEVVSGSVAVAVLVRDADGVSGDAVADSERVLDCVSVAVSVRVRGAQSMYTRVVPLHCAVGCGA